jgi:hypothetical protein
MFSMRCSWAYIGLHFVIGEGQDISSF